MVISIGTIMYMIEGNEPNTQFNNIPNSIYWACVTMTTVGYGDITPTTPLGRFLSAVVMLIGYTIIAVPTGIVSVSMMREQKERGERVCPNCHKASHDPDAEYCDHCGTKLE
jgi:voltage-gated potassium channel